MEDFDDSRFREKINIVLEAHKIAENQTGWGKCKEIVQCVFTAFSPFAKNFLDVAKDGSNLANARSVTLADGTKIFAGSPAEFTSVPR